MFLGVACGTGPAATRPNVLLISIDTLRADALSCYGCTDATSPNLDALAASGVRFEQATSTSSWTLPAHLSLLTGLTVSAHGICDERLWDAVGQPGGPRELPLRGEYLSETLLRAGYRTAGYYSWRYLTPEFGFGPGFETWSRIGDTVWGGGPKHERYAALQRAGDQAALEAWRAEAPADFDEQRPSANLVVDAGLEWLDARGPEPFFLFLHLFDAHDDYLPPPPFNVAFDKDYTGMVDGRMVSAPGSKIHGGLPPADRRHLEALYHGEVAWIDSQLGRLFAGLEARGLRDDTLIVVTSDHGEEFYEHGAKIHRTHLYRESVEVPLIFSWPRGLPASRRVAGPVGLVDIAPTIAALTDAPSPCSVSGRDLSPLLSGEASNSAVPYLSELMLFERGSPIPVRHTALLAGTDHWLRVVDREGRPSGVYFDRSENPLEEGPGEAFGPGSERMAAFDALLARVRTKTESERNAAPSRADLFRIPALGITKELGGMGYLGSDVPIEMRDSPLLCLDGCFSQIPTAKSPDSQ